MLKLYYTDVSNISAELPKEQMSAYRLKTLEKLKPIQSRKQSIGAELLLNYAVKDNLPEHKLPLVIKTAEFGKPYAEDLPLYFSLSHSGDKVICAISDSEVGADIQKPSQYRENLARRHFSEAEYNYINEAADMDAAFTEIWAKKESCIKADGEGITLRLNSFSVIPDNEIEIKNRKLSLWSGRIDDYAVSACTIGNRVPEPVLIEIKL